MTKEQINIAIAEACGWKHLRGFHWKNPNGLSMFEWDIYDYCNDLNAMHEAEKELTCDQQVEYSIKIGKLTTRNLPGSKAAWMDFSLIRATAAQRAEAFLRTIGKWEGGPQ